MRLACGFALISACWCASASAVPPLASLLPDTTKGYLSSPDVPLLQSKWEATEMGRWMDDPLMKPFRDDLQEQVRDENDPDRIRYGLTWDDVKDLARGEAAVALVHAPPKRPVRVVLVDVTGNQDAAAAVLNKIFKSLLDPKKKAHQRATSFKQDPNKRLTVFDLPKHSKDPHRPLQTAYFIKDNVLAAVEDGELAKVIMGRAGGAKGASLEDVASYQKVMRRCEADAKTTDAGPPQLRWYFHPVPYAEARRQLDPQFLKDGKVDLLRALKNSGFQGIKAAGGFAHLGSGPFDIFNRAAMYAPPPYDKTLAGLKTPNTEPVAPPSWVPASVASYTGMSIEWPVFMENVAPLYDNTIGDEEGAWKDTLRGIREDKDGPKVDLEKRLFTKMGARAMRISDVVEPITTTSERRLIVADLADAKEALAALEAFYAKDQTAKKVKSGQYEYWEISSEDPQPGDVPSGVAVARNQLLYASQAKVLDKFFQDMSQEKQLGQDDTFRKVMEHVQAEAKKRSWDKLCIQRFVNSRAAYKPTFELTRQNKLPLSDTLLGSVLNMLVGQDPGGKPRKQAADGKKLPEYSKVEHYFLPAGSLGVREDADDFQGWFGLGFSLAKDAAAVAARKGE